MNKVHASMLQEYHDHLSDNLTVGNENFEITRKSFRDPSDCFGSCGVRCICKQKLSTEMKRGRWARL